MALVVGNIEGCVARVDHRWAVTSFCYIHCHILSAASFRSLSKVIKAIFWLVDGYKTTKYIALILRWHPKTKGKWSLHCTTLHYTALHCTLATKHPPRILRLCISEPASEQEGQHQLGDAFRLLTLSPPLFLATPPRATHTLPYYTYTYI